MPTIHDPPPAAVRADLTALKQALGSQIPAKAPAQNLLIATWNIRSFGSLTRKWTAAGTDRPKRDLRGLLAIKEVISRFDVIAVQEIVGNLRALRDLMKSLGPDWAFLMTDITLGQEGNNERLGFIYDRERVTPSGLAAELVVPPEQLAEIRENALREQFARTPYAVSFRAGSTTFILVTLHVTFGDRSADRIPELQAIAKWMADWARREHRFHHNLIVLGDFNIDRREDPLWQAFTSTGLTVPNELNEVPRSIFADPNQPTREKFYDQIAWFTSAAGRHARLTMEMRSGGGFDFLPFVYRDQNLSKNSISYRLSDHLPLWAEFGLS